MLHEWTYSLLQKGHITLIDVDTTLGVYRSLNKDYADCDITMIWAFILNYSAVWILLRYGQSGATVSLWAEKQNHIYV